MANLVRTAINTFTHLLHGERYTPTPRAKDSTIHMTSGSFVAIVTNEDHGIGSGVAISDRIILTVAHNFNNCSLNKTTLFVPSIKSGIRIKSGSLFPDIDLAVLETSSSMRVTPARIDTETNLFPGLSVHSHSTVQVDQRNFEESYLKRQFSLTHRQGDYSFQAVTLGSPSDIFRLKTIHGDSGAGIFNSEGQLLSLVKTSGGILTPTTGAIRLSYFRNRLRDLGII